jgi:hypothetical protein
LVVVDPEWWSKKENIMAVQKAVSTSRHTPLASAPLECGTPPYHGLRSGRSSTGCSATRPALEIRIPVTTVASATTANAMTPKVHQVTTTRASLDSKATLTYEMDAKVRNNYIKMCCLLPQCSSSTATLPAFNLLIHAMLLLHQLSKILIVLLIYLVCFTYILLRTYKRLRNFVTNLYD